MKLMVIGGGGREHAIIKKLKENPAVEKIYCLPGNGGIAADAVCVSEIGAKDIPAQVEFAKAHGIDYAVVAPDDPLALGAVDALSEAGIPCFGPDKKAAVIEASKAFAKDLMQKYNIPTAKYRVFTDAPSACAYIDAEGAPIVVKADGLALGKGVVVAQTVEEAKAAVQALHACGINKVVMMTGDNRKTAESVAAEVGVDEVYAEVLPEDKAAFIRSEKAKGRTVIMIGDGVNDSPALSEADAGIAISTGAAIAREVADITIASEDLFELVTLRRLSEALMRRIHGNYRFIVSFNLMLIVLGVIGILPPATSALLHNASTLAISLRSMTNILENLNGIAAIGI